MFARPSDGKARHMSALSIHVAAFENRTTRTELKAGKKEPLAAHFLCFVDRGMVIELPPRTCARGHKVHLTLEVKHAKKKDLRFTASAVVNDVASSPGERDSVTIELVGYEQSDWEWILGAYQERQSDVSELFMKLRGQ